MRAASGRIAALMLGFLEPGFAQTLPENSPPAITPGPEGWTFGADGPVHTESGTVCPAESDGFNPVALSGPSEPNILGICYYEDSLGTGDAGVRVRRYLRDVGETPEAIANDRLLMEPRPGEPPPLFTVRIEPFTSGGVKRSARVTITKMVHGLLVDCFAEDADFGAATAKIAGVCGK
jgi:hypothetical protein